MELRDRMHNPSSRRLGLMRPGRTLRRIVINAGCLLLAVATAGCGRDGTPTVHDENGEDRQVSQANSEIPDADPKLAMPGFVEFDLAGESYVASEATEVSYSELLSSPDCISILFGFSAVTDTGVVLDLQVHKWNTPLASGDAIRIGPGLCDGFLGITSVATIVSDETLEGYRPTARVPVFIDRFVFDSKAGEVEVAGHFGPVPLEANPDNPPDANWPSETSVSGRFGLRAPVSRQDGTDEPLLVERTRVAAPSLPNVAPIKIVGPVVAHVFSDSFIYVPVAASKAALITFGEAVRIDDKKTITKLYHTERVFDVEQNTMVHVVTEDPEGTQVRVLRGPHKDELGWVVPEMVIKPAATGP